jgi:hypothetical protein
MTRLLLCTVLLTLACHSPGPLGHSVQYAPTSEESSAVSGIRELDPVMVRRMPEAGKAYSLFGVVLAKLPGPDGLTDVTLSQRRLLPRNLCENMNDEDTCRVSVTDQEFGLVHVLTKLTVEDESGGLPVMPGSLMRYVGKLERAPNKDDGAPVLRSTYYRHFPPRTYRTQAAAEFLRQ